MIYEELTTSTDPYSNEEMCHYLVQAREDSLSFSPLYQPLHPT